MYTVLITAENFPTTINKTFTTEDEALEFENEVLSSAETWFTIEQDAHKVYLANPATTVLPHSEATALGLI